VELAQNAGQALIRCDRWTLTLQFSDLEIPDRVT
jgi:hypothetical protein